MAATRSRMEMNPFSWKTIGADCKLTSEALLDWRDSAAIHEPLREVLSIGGWREMSMHPTTIDMTQSRNI